MIAQDKGLYDVLPIWSRPCQEVAHLPPIAVRRGNA